MKKFTLLLSALLFCFGNVWSQKIKYEKSFEEARINSREKNKPLLIIITIDPPAYVTDFMSGLKDPEVVKKFNESFIIYSINRSDSASLKIIRQYNVNSFPSYIFIDSKAGLMFKEWGALPPPRLLSMADRAIAASKERSMTDLDLQYRSGIYTKQFLKEYITRRMNAGITNNSYMIEKYVDSLGIADLDNYGQVLFIMKSGPLADGRAYKLASTNRKIVDSIYKHELFDVRKMINDRIIENTMTSAIAYKSQQRAIAAASFARTSWGRDFMQGHKTYGSKMLQYYMAIKDTTNYLQQASVFYEQHYMHISADSIRKMDKLSLEKAKSNANEQAALNIPPGGAIRSVSFRYAESNFATELNNGAYSVYQTGTRNNSYLTKALVWSKRSIELKPLAAYYDTLSHLLYRLGFYSEAEGTQQKAVELAKAENANVKRMQDELIKIKNRAL